MELFILFFGLLSNDGTIASNSYIVENCDKAAIEARVENELDLISQLGLDGILVHTCEGFTQEEGVVTGDPA